jgi:hypothetical protein
MGNDTCVLPRFIFTLKNSMGISFSLQSIKYDLVLSDLSTLGYALRLRWEWQARALPDKPWADLPTKAELNVRAMFEASVTVQTGNGARTLFWKHRWLQGSAVEDLAPDVVAAVPKRIRNRRLVVEALHDDQWICDISGSLSTRALTQYVLLWDRLQSISLCPGVDGKFVWKWSIDQQYSASSAYRTFFFGQCSVPGAKELSKATAPKRCKFSFGSRCWIDVGHRRGFSRTACRIVAIVRCAIKRKRMSTTFFLDAPSAGKSGFVCSGRPVSIS